MLTDVFFRRYEKQKLWSDYYKSDQSFWFQIASLVVKEVLPPTSMLRDQAVDFPSMKEIVRRVTMEAGASDLPTNKEYAWGFTSNSTYHEQVWTFLRMPPPTIHDNVDAFIKYKLSLVEIIFRMVGEAPRTDPAPTPNRMTRIFKGRSSITKSFARQAYSAGFIAHVDELNQRLKQAGYPVSYNNGYLQLRDETVIAREISAPFWKVMDGPDWQNASVDMAEALDIRDNGGLNPALYAAKALESVIKIISDKKGWTTGNERGASSYVDNLVSRSNGRFIEPWEADAIKAFFSKVRNPLGHGAGSEAMIKLTKQQDNWAIETCMSWIKSLVTRM